MVTHQPADAGSFAYRRWLRARSIRYGTSDCRSVELQTEQDFYDLMAAYLRRADADGVRRAEMFFDPQTHTDRGVGFDVFMEGFTSAMADAEAETGISSALIMCFLRHLPGEAACETFRAAEGWLDRIVGVGLDSSEVDHRNQKTRKLVIR